MDTIFILRDTVVTNAVKEMDSCKPFFKEAETNWTDVTMTAIICITILVIAYIIKNGILSWQERKFSKQNEEDDKKREHELAVKDKEQSFKEMAEENVHKRKIFDKIIDFTLKEGKELSPSDTENYYGKMKVRVVKMKNYFNKLWNEE